MATAPATTIIIAMSTEAMVDRAECFIAILSALIVELSYESWDTIRRASDPMET